MEKVLRLIYFVTVLCIVCLTYCSNMPNDFGGKIISIKFSDEWNDGHIGTPAISFPTGTQKVYYEITFQGKASKPTMVKKEWQLPGSRSFYSVCCMPNETKRLCGELHYHDNRDMDAGTYTISVFYTEDNQNFEEYPYEDTVNRSFTVNN